VLPLVTTAASVLAIARPVLAESIPQVAGIAAQVSAGSGNEMQSELLTYFLKSCIEWALPTAALGLIAFIFGKALSTKEGRIAAPKRRSPLEKLLLGGADER